MNARGKSRTWVRVALVISLVVALFSALSGCHRQPQPSGPGYYGGPMVGKKVAPPPARNRYGGPGLDMDS